MVARTAPYGCQLVHGAVVGACGPDDGGPAILPDACHLPGSLGLCVGWVAVNRCLWQVQELRPLALRHQNVGWVAVVFGRCKNCFHLLCTTRMPLISWKP